MHDYLNEHRAALIDELADWVRLPSIAGVAEHEPDLARSANWLAARLGEIGFPTVGIWPAANGPAVYAEWCEVPGAPTVLIYSHHDVRAAKDEQWDQTSPFEPALRRGRLYGRGASDAKGQVVAHLWGLRAHLRERGVPAVNLKVLVEGEEEVGSPGLAALLDEHQVKADLVLYSDTLLWHAEHPALCLSLRGAINAQLRVLGPERDVHSGAVSGAAPNPAIALCQLLARLHDERGRITLPGFYDRVVEQPGAYADLPYDDRDWLARSDSRHIVGEHGYTVPQRLWARPAAEVTSLLSGDPVGAARGAVPAVATAAISIRTVGDQRASEVAEQLRRWVAEAMPEGVEYELTVAEEVLQEPYRTPDDLPAAALLAEAMQEGFGVPKVHRMGNAGGGPADLLAHHVGAPVLFFGTGLPEDCWHDSDESVSIDVLLAGAATLAGFWGRLAEQ
jgi:acetylornithine deacetylase/succinyl-diaminopimelate desuccinylase-like protein